MIGTRPVGEVGEIIGEYFYVRDDGTAPRAGASWIVTATGLVYFVNNGIASDPGSIDRQALDAYPHVVRKVVPVNLVVPEGL